MAARRDRRSDLVVPRATLFWRTRKGPRAQRARTELNRDVEPKIAGKTPVDRRAEAWQNHWKQPQLSAHAEPFTDRSCEQGHENHGHRLGARRRSRSLQTRRFPRALRDNDLRWPYY